MEINGLRERIDAIDGEMARLFAARMDVAAQIGRYKKERGLPVMDAPREREKLRAMAELSPGELREDVLALYAFLFALSRGHQTRIHSGEGAPTVDSFPRGEPGPDQAVGSLPRGASVACTVQARVAAESLIDVPEIEELDTPAMVLDAVSRGRCRYGVVSVGDGAVYDSLARRGLRIVRGVRVGGWRYACVSGAAEVYPGADRFCCVAALPREPGALRGLLAFLCASQAELLCLERIAPEEDGPRYVLEVRAGERALARFRAGLAGVCARLADLGRYEEAT